MIEYLNLQQLVKQYIGADLDKEKIRYALLTIHSVHIWLLMWELLLLKKIHLIALWLQKYSNTYRNTHA